MANTATQFGFRHIGYLGGGAPDYQLTTRAIQSTYSTVIANGDVVVQTNATSPYIIQATGTTTPSLAPIGVFQGSTYRAAGGIQQWSPTWPAAAAVDGTAYIVDAPNAIFLCAVSSAAITTANIGHCAAFTTSGLTATTVGGGFSVMTLDSGTIGTAAGTAASYLPFRVLAMYQGVGNGSDPTTNFNWVVVGFNFAQNRSLSV